jgi:uncharacterized protein DUF2568
LRSQTGRQEETNIRATEHPAVRAVVLTNLAVRFLLELGVLAALAFGGAQVGQGLAMKIGLGVGAPVLAAVVWGAFVAPRAAKRLPDPWRLLPEAAVFGAAAVALALAGHATLAWALAIAAALNRALIALLQW